MCQQHFLYPVRIICQYKYYAKNRVELNHIRDFGGIMADISEKNYTIKGEAKNIPDRYTYRGAFFSATAFQEMHRNMHGLTTYLWCP